MVGNGGKGVWGEGGKKNKHAVYRFQPAVQHSQREYEHGVRASHFRELSLNVLFVVAKRLFGRSTSNGAGSEARIEGMGVGLF